MAKQDIIISIQLKGAEGVSKSTDKVANSQKQLREMMSRSAVELEKLNIKKKRQKELNVQIAKSELGYSEAVGKTAAQLKASKTQAGLNNAILLESGRLASDASYGFTAMANNLSQLVSLFGSFAKTSGGLVASLKDLGRSLLGTGGVLLGVQLLIGALQSERVIKFIKSLGGLSARLRELGDLSDGFSQATEELVGNFDIYTRKLMDSNESEEQKAIALKKLNDEYPDFNASILTSADNTEEATEAIDRYIKKLKEQALSQAAIQQFREVEGELSKELFDNQLKQLELEEKLTEQKKTLEKATQDAAENTNIALRENFAQRAGQAQAEVAYTERAIENLKEESDEIALQYKKRLDIIDDFIILVDDKENKGRSRRKKAYKEGDLDFEKERQQSREREIKSIIKNERIRLNIEMEGIKERAKIKQKEFVEDEKRRLDAFKRRTDDAEAIAEATKLSNAAIANSEDELKQYIVRINEETNQKLLQLDNEFARKRYDNKVKNDAELAELELQSETADILNEGLRARELFDLEGERLEEEKKRLEGELAFRASFMFGILDDQKTRIQLEEQLTQVENEQSKRRIKISEIEAQAKREALAVTADALEADYEIAGEYTSTGKSLAIA